MPEHPEAPDRIDLTPPVGAFWWRGTTNENDPNRTPYLRATPARLAADQMLEALKKVTKWSKDGRFMTAERLPHPMEREVDAAIAAAQGDRE